MITLIFGVLVWKGIMTLEEAERMKLIIGSRKIPKTIKEVVAELEKASKHGNTKK
jgi:hypothetical protein